MAQLVKTERHGDQIIHVFRLLDGSLKPVACGGRMTTDRTEQALLAMAQGRADRYEAERRPPKETQVAP